MSKIITFGNSAYIEVAKLWLKYISKLDLMKNVSIIALDEQIKKELSKYNVDIIDAGYDIKSKGINDFWKFRCEIFLEIYEKYGSFIHSDLDAIWLKNPITYLKNIENNLIFSQGTIHPLKVFKKFGIVACCGFFQVNESAASKLFLKKLISDVELYGDDQESVNNILFKNKINLNFKNPYHEKITFNNKESYSLKCSNLPICGELKNFYGQKLSIAYLPHKFFTRVNNLINKDTIVAHPLTAKNNEDKLKTFKELHILI